VVAAGLVRTLVGEHGLELRWLELLQRGRGDHHRARSTPHPAGQAVGQWDRMVKDGDAWQAGLGAAGQREQLALPAGGAPRVGAGDEAAA